MRTSIRLKLIGPLILIMIILIIMMIVTFYSLGDIHKDEERRTVYFFEFAAISEIEAAIAGEVMPIHDYIINDDPLEKISYERNVRETDSLIKNFKTRFFQTPEEKIILNKVERLQQQIKLKAKQILTLSDPSKDPVLTNQIMKDMDAKRDQAVSYLNKFQEIDKEEIKESMIAHTHIISNSQNNLYISFLAVSLVVIIFIFVVSAFVSQPLLTLHKGVKQMSQGNLSARVSLKTNDEIEDLANTFNEMAFNLNQEQETAAKIQRRLLPSKLPRVPGVKLHAKQALAKLVGGDWYDYYTLGDDLIILIADASGKGMPGALLSTVAMTTMRSEPKLELSIVDLVKKTNQTVVKRLGAGDFITLFLAKLNLSTLELSYVNCGQEPPLICRPPDKGWHLLKTSSGLPIGVSETNFYPKLENIKLNKGDRLLLYTDGLHDIRNLRGDFFELDLIINWLTENNHLPIKSLIDNLLDAAVSFCENQIKDDISLVGLEISPP